MQNIGFLICCFIVKPLAFLLFFASFATAQTCRTPDFPSTGTVDGALQRTDCFISDYLKDYPDLRVPAHAWKLIVKKTAVYKIRLASVTMDPFVLIADSTGTIVDYDDDGAGGTDSELLIQITPGEYTVFATVAYGALGSYKLTGESSPVRQCRPQSLTMSVDVDGEITASDCRYADLIPMISSHSTLDTYSLESNQPFIMTARMDSTGVDSFLGIIGGDGKVVQFDDNSGGGKNARLRLSVPAGTSVIYATTTVPGAGFYKLRVDSEDRRTCEIKTINPGNTTQGQLDRDGCRYLDAFSGSKDESRTARYKFELRQTVLVRLGVSSTEFDPYLTLFGSDGKVIGENDNADRGTTNSAVNISLAAGTYTAVVRGNRSGVGIFEVSLGTENTKTCELTALAMPGATNGTLNASQCRYLDVTTPSASTFAAQIYKFTIETPTFVTINATGTGYTPIIDIQSPTGKLVSSFRTASKQEQLLLPGEYRLVVWNRTSVGNFAIVAETREPASCPALEIAVGASATGTLNGLDCMLRELVALPSPQFPADVYTFQLTEPDTITATVVATKDEFLPDVYILDADSKIVKTELDSVKAELKPGTYRVVVSTWFTGGGDYKLTVAGAVRPTQ